MCSFTSLTVLLLTMFISTSFIVMSIVRTTSGVTYRPYPWPLKSGGSDWRTDSQRESLYGQMETLPGILCKSNLSRKLNSLWPNKRGKERRWAGWQEHVLKCLIYWFECFLLMHCRDDELNDREEGTYTPASIYIMDEVLNLNFICSLYKLTTNIISDQHRKLTLVRPCATMQALCYRYWVQEANNLGAQERCVYMNSNASMADYNCNNTANYVCMKENNGKQ